MLPSQAAFRYFPSRISNASEQRAVTNILREYEVSGTVAIISKIFEFAAFNELVLPSLEAAPARSHIAPVRESRVNYQANLVDAPSIGPKTAQRFADIGITTIAQFLSAKPSVI